MYKKLALLLAVMAASSVCAATAQAASANRTFVSNSGVSGNTTQGCSAASPCDTFTNALSVTNSGGEINCLNAGDFGTVSIAVSVTINCEGPSNGGITASTPGGSAIVINAAVDVTLIGLDINSTASGGVGINIAGSPNVVVRNCKIHNFSGNGGSGIQLQAGTLVVDNSLIVQNNTGIFEFDTSGGLNMSVRNSDISYNSNAGIRITVDGGSHAGATIEQTTLAFNGDGVSLTGGVAVIGGSTIVNNTIGVANSGGTVFSFKNNQIGGNGTDGTPLTAYPGGPLN